MSYALKVKLMIVLAVVLVLPFLVFEIYAVFKLGFVEPYSYALSVPIVVFSFVILQFAIGFGVVRGWSVCDMRGNCIYLMVWVLAVIVLLALPEIFTVGEV
ncbi:hypothetical protein [uncultured Pseudomonas sp.]|uniref:hypothetical protein n=1 Tax=uncultured Pseudomonas sp. TaxID=114707 RepID=UPI00280650B2|nr:hypothetical protein [uncultured Pseudomonas sp.]